MSIPHSTGQIVSDWHEARPAELSCYVRVCDTGCANSCGKRREGKSSSICSYRCQSASQMTRLWTYGLSIFLGAR